MDQFKLLVEPENVEKVKTWLAERGGVASWESQDLSCRLPGWSTPALTEDGQPYPRPHWSCPAQPSLVITDPAEIGVPRYEEYRRGKLALRVKPNRMAVVLTDACSAKVNRWLSQAGEGSTYYFDYDQVVVLKAVGFTPLADYKEDGQND